MDPSPLPEPADLPIGLEGLLGRTFAAVLFDLDGTLIDSTPVVTRSWLAWAQAEGVDPAGLRGLHGIPSAGIVARLLPAERHEAALARINQMELTDTDGITVLPGAREALAALPAGRSAIATSCTRPLATIRLAATGLTPPAVVVTSDETPRGKPDPAPYLLAARRLGVDPATCLVVEDAPAGLASAHAAGCASVAVATSNPVHALKAAEAHTIIRDLAMIRFESGPDGVRVTQDPHAGSRR